MRIKKNTWLAISFIVITLLISLFVYKTIPIRTAIFRTFVTSNNYISTDNDTIYSFGYYGVRKWLYNHESDELIKLHENSSFCKSSLIGYLMARSGIVKDSILFTAARSYLAGPDEYDDKNYVNGKLLVMRKSDLGIIHSFKSDIKLIETKIIDNYLIVSGLKGFDIYDVSFPANPIIKCKYRTSNFSEFQGIETFHQGGKRYVCFARFAEGVSIFDISNVNKPYEVWSFSFNRKIHDIFLPQGLQCFKVYLDYPYLYSTVAPMSSHLQTDDDLRGILVFDISDLHKVKENVALMPKSTYYKNRIGDPQPTFLAKFADHLYVNYGENGIGVFDITSPFAPKYSKILPISKKKVNMILPIHIDDKGTLFIGDYYSSDIFRIKLVN